METKTIAGFQARFIDRLMRSPHAEIVWPIIAACSIVVTILISIDWEEGSLRPSSVPRARWFLLALPGLIFAIGGWWTVHTWKRVWRKGRSSWERIVYDYGVRMSGFIMAVAHIFLYSSLGWMSDSGGRVGLMLGGAITAVFFGVPISLHLGYFGGIALAALLGVKNDPRVEVGEPPPLP